MRCVSDVKAKVLPVMRKREIKGVADASMPPVAIQCSRLWPNLSTE